MRLRREAWGGMAFDRGQGDMLELDREGFAVLAILAAPHSLRDLRESLQRQGHGVRLPELAAFVGTLEDRGLVVQVEADAPPLPVGCRVAAGEDAAAAGLAAPVVAHWVLTYHCNLRCAYCYWQEKSHAEPEPRVRLRLVERLADWGVLEVALGGGEPTLVRGFAQLLRTIRAAGMVPNVTTNGLVRSESVIRALAEHAGVVQLSADQPQLLDAARGKGVFGRLARTARRLRAAGARLGMNLLLTPQNVLDIRLSLDAALRLGVESVTFVRPKGAWVRRHWPGFPGIQHLGQLAKDLRKTVGWDEPASPTARCDRRRLAWAREWWDSQARPTLPLRLYVDTALRGPWAALGLLDDPEPEVLGCGGGQRHVAILPDGDVYPCSHACQPALRLGNLLTDPFEQLWSAGRGRTARNRYLKSCRGVDCPCC